MTIVEDPIELEQTNTHECPIIGIGASAGGLEAIRDMFASVGAASDQAFVIVQHLDPTHVSMMAELMDRHTGLEVRQIEGGERVQPGRAYVIPPGASLTIDDGVLTLSPFDEPRGVRRPIDDFFHSLARDQGPNAACIILSGTGSDGSAGLRAIKERGGICAVQKPSTARFDGMPMSAIGTGLVDFILPVEELCPRLAAFFENKEETEKAAELSSFVSDHVQEICRALQKTVGHDFTGYKPSTIMRRIERRMHVLEIQEASNYLKRIEADEQECEALFRDLLINVTNFFRDPDIFEKVREIAIADTVRRAETSRTIRVWVPGCSSGEEAYTIAILFAEEIKAQDKVCDVQIFATDIDEQMLSQAREGRYSLSGLKHIPSGIRDGYVYGSEGHFEITSAIRDMVHFSTHSLIKDPPFSKLDFVSCRNLLIYLGDEIQKAVIPLFHYALKPDGYLLLGSSESIGSFDDLFEAVDQKARIYRRRPGKRAYPRNFPISTGYPGDGTPQRRARRPSHAQEPVVANAASEKLLSAYAPAHIIIDRHGDIVTSRGKLTKFLDFPSGEPTRHLLSLARRELRDALSPLLRRATETQRRQARQGVEIRSEFGVQTVDIVVDPMADGTVLIVLPEADAFRQEIAGDVVDAPEPVDVVHDLEEELRLTRFRLRATVEDLETANEELKSSNEEMMSMNEELQSSNEELSTVNEEIKSKADQLAILNADMRHFLESTDFALVVVDEALQVRNFTASITEIFPLNAGDRGRNLTEVRSFVDDDRIFEDCRVVLETGRPVQRLVVRNDGTKTYSMKIRPYRTTPETIEGATLTFSDVSNLEETKQALETQSERLRIAISAAGMGVWDFETESGKTNVDATIREFYGMPPTGEPLLSDFLDVIHEDDRDEVARTLSEAGESGAPWNNSFRVPKPDGKTIWLQGSGRVVETRGTQKMFGVNFDITEQKEAFEARDLLLREMNHRVKNLFAVISSMVSLARRDTDDPDRIVTRVRDQISALAAAHNITQQRQSFRTIPLPELVEAIMSPFRATHAIALDGPQIDVSTQVITPLGLILFEWATNASKYGALSNSDGRVTIKWSVQPLPEGQSEVVIGWSETGGPAVTEPDADRLGFGSRLIESSARQLDGQLADKWRKDGVQRTLAFPLSGLD
ncbi:chemotaxis protein CheB [Jannaschia sp. KMU-145]|uniref:chemotaxis protein CheB n=1 Tax=Jannaschia halovivens TaxID=3388667 RepID=UPI00396B2190